MINTAGISATAAALLTGETVSVVDPARIGEAEYCTRDSIMTRMGLVSPKPGVNNLEHYNTLHWAAKMAVNNWDTACDTMLGDWIRSGKGTKEEQAHLSEQEALHGTYGSGGWEPSEDYNWYAGFGGEGLSTGWDKAKERGIGATLELGGKALRDGIAAAGEAALNIPVGLVRIVSDNAGDALDHLIPSMPWYVKVIGGAFVVTAFAGLVYGGYKLIGTASKTLGKVVEKKLS